jgi:hypothetical protein
MSQENRRKYERHEVDLAVRFISQKDLEACGKITDISEGGLAMMTNAAAEVGDSVIIYPEGLGRIEGVVRRRTENGLAVEFCISEKQRAHLAKRIQSAITGVPYIRLLENRGHGRMTLTLSSEACVGPCGKPFPCEIIDLSPSGALIKSQEQPKIGSDIRIGAIRGFVRRHTPDGFALQFAVADELDSCLECA